MCEIESHWVPHSYGFLPHLSKKLSKFLPLQFKVNQRVIAMKRFFITSRCQELARHNLIQFFVIPRKPIFRRYHSSARDTVSVL